MSNVLIDRQKIDILANAISNKSGVPVTMTLDEMVEAVDNIELKPALQAKTYTVNSAGTATVTADSGYDGLSEVQVSVPSISGWEGAFFNRNNYVTISGTRYWKPSAGIEIFSDGWVDMGAYSESLGFMAVESGTSVTPTESSQTIGGANYMMEGAVTVNAIPSNYVGSEITQRDVSDVTVSGRTVNIPGGYYSDGCSVDISSGTAGTPTATKGAVSNHSISVTPSVTNTTGYITGSTINGTAVTVSASELVSGTYTVDSSGTKDVTNYASVNVPSCDLGVPSNIVLRSDGKIIYRRRFTDLTPGYLTYLDAIDRELWLEDKSVTPTTSQQVITPTDNYSYLDSVTVSAMPSGTAGTPTATKGSVSNYSISVTPSVTNTTGYITGSTKTGTAVTVSASELVSGTYTVDSSGTKDVTNYASALVPAMGTPTWGSTHSGTDKGDIGLQTYDQYFNIPSGYNDSATYYTIPAVDVVTKNITANGTYSAVVDGHMGYSSVTVNVSGGGGSGSSVSIGETDATSTTASISFTGLLGEPTSFYISFVGESGIDLPTGTPYKTIDVVYDGTSDFGNIATNTNNAQASYSTNFSHTYSNGTLTVTGTESNFVGHYLVLYSYGGGTVDTKDVQVGSGATSITFTGLEDEPVYWSCAFKDNFGTSSGYERVISTASGYNTFTSTINGYSMNTAVVCRTAAWTASYNNGSLTITSSSTNIGGYFHQPGYYQLTYAYDNGSGGGSGTYQTKTVTPSTSQQVVTADTGYDALSQVTVNAMPTGTAGTPTATKGTVSNHSISVTPSVTNTSGYITGSTKTGTAVSVSASELVSGNKAITENGTNIDVTNYATVSVSISGGGGSNARMGGKYDDGGGDRTSISFYDLLGEPTSFAVYASNDIPLPSGTPYKVSAVVYDGTDHHAQILTNTSNAQASYDSSSFSHTYSNGTLTVTSTGAHFTDTGWVLFYSYNGTSANVHTADVQVGSGATSITFTGLENEPIGWYLIFKSNFGTSSGYQRVIFVGNRGTGTYEGLCMDSQARSSTSYWTGTYSNGSLTITSQGTNAGGYFHQPGYYQLTYVLEGESPYERVSKTYRASTLSQTLLIEPSTGYEAMSRVNVTIPAITQTNLVAGNIKSGTTVAISDGESNLWSVTGTYTGSGGTVNIDTKTLTNSTATATSLQFTSMLGQPKAFFLRLTAQIARNSSYRYYYVENVRYNGTNTNGRYFYQYSGQLTNDTTHYSYSYSGTTLTISSTGSQSGAGGSFYNGAYELVYIY